MRGGHTPGLLHEFCPIHTERTQSTHQGPYMYLFISGQHIKYMPCVGKGCKGTHKFFKQAGTGYRLNKLVLLNMK